MLYAVIKLRNILQVKTSFHMKVQMLPRAQTIPVQICFLLSLHHFLQLLDMSVEGNQDKN